MTRPQLAKRDLEGVRWSIARDAVECLVCVRGVGDDLGVDGILALVDRAQDAVAARRGGILWTLLVSRRASNDRLELRESLANRRWSPSGSLIAGSGTRFGVNIYVINRSLNAADGGKQPRKR